MSTARRCRLSRPLWCSLLLTLSVMGQNQTPSAPQKLSLTAALVLTPEFCATPTPNGKGTLKMAPVGKAACTDLEPALKGIFIGLTRVDDSSKAGDAEVVLEPKFNDVRMTNGTVFHPSDELVVLVEWTGRDQSGKVVWIETVQGSAKRHISGWSPIRSLKQLVEDSVQDMAKQSATKISSSPQLLKVSAQLVK